ncbi:HAD family hydrolase [Antribacter gilvus]|uniref:HAD family hydrolase n=1 Tax=Antribacter gilvus TaxID=2304675 RepID=UPI0019810083|nr:HAD-IA family hydrolase [Antribacter gilvus]
MTRSTHLFATPSATPSPATGLDAVPDALLLDFGGVVFQTRKRPEAWAEVAVHVSEVLARAGHRIGAQELEPVLRGGNKALKDWKNASSRRLEPRELTHREIWRDFYGSPLPAAAREVLVGSAGALQAYLTATVAEHVVRPGVRELLALAAERGVRLGIVSNAHAGRAHRELLAAHCLDDAFGVQVYSDEVGIRKPHPGMIELAAAALGTTPARSWYVGDTFDRDVVAGRRAGVGAVVLTRHHHTDSPPFPVTETADAVFDTPEGLVEVLAAAGREPAPADPTPGEVPVAAEAGAAVGRPSALLLDHGGVIAVSVPDVGARLAFAAHLARRLGRAGYYVTFEEAGEVVAAARRRHKEWKAAREADVSALADPGAPPVVPEIDATTFWTGLAAPGLLALLPPEQHAGATTWLRVEAHALMVGFARSKSLPTVRPGLREVLEAARALGVPVAVVSNTVNGRAVREELDEAGLTHLVGVHVYSDELGRRKPDPLMPGTALHALGADPARAWFVGDKPRRDVAAARAAGVGTVVLVRGGSSSDAEIDQAPAHLRPDHVIAHLGELVGLALDHP